MESVPDEVKLDALVQGAVRAETRQVVHLDEPRLELLINHDVHAKDLEARRIFEIIRLAGAVGMLKGRLHGDHCLYADVLYLVQHDVSAKSWLLLLDVVKDGREGAFRASVVVNVVVLHEVARRFVDCIIGQVHEKVVKVILLWPYIGLCGKPGETLLEHEHSQRVHAEDEHVDSQVELQIID